MEHASELDRRRVRELLGREPLGAFKVVVRDEQQDPVVIQNAPLLDDGTPMPTRYWLVGPGALRQVGQLEAAGGVRAAETAVDPAELAAAHERYAAERDAALPPGHTGPRPSGGVGGTRTGVKCLHAHYAWHLAGGEDPVGRWVAEELEAHVRTVELQLEAQQVVMRAATGWSQRLAVDAGALDAFGLNASDPPAPEDLTNALGAIEDAFNDLLLVHPELRSGIRLRLTGELARTVVKVEIGSDQIDDEVRLSRAHAEEVFRTVATENNEDRRHNPGLPPEHVGLVVAASCVVVGTLRKFQLDSVLVS
jgi:hypothetical protein